MYYTPENDPEIIAIPVGMFADPSLPAPSYSVYERMHSWVNLNGDIEHLDWLEILSSNELPRPR